MLLFMYALGTAPGVRLTTPPGNPGHVCELLSVLDMILFLSVPWVSPGAMFSLPAVTESSQMRLSLSYGFAAAQPCCFSLRTLPSFSLHPCVWLLACAFLSFVPYVPSHPSLSARFLHPGFLWHLSIVLIHLAVQIFTFLKPSVFL